MHPEVDLSDKAKRVAVSTAIANAEEAIAEIKKVHPGASFGCTVSLVPALGPQAT